MPVDYQFDASAVEPSQGFDSLPPGKYQVYISNTSMPKDKNGKDMLMVEYTVFGMGPPHDGLKAFDRFNLFNDNETARRIANQELSALCHCVGVFQVTMRDDGAALRNAQLIIEIEKQKNSDQTQVATRFDRAGNAPGKKGATAAPGKPPASAPPAAAPPAGGPPPGWGAPVAAPSVGAPVAPQAPPVAPPAAPPAGWGAPAAPPVAAGGPPPAGWAAPGTAPAAPPAAPPAAAPAWAAPAGPGAAAPAWAPPA